MEFTSCEGFVAYTRYIIYRIFSHSTALRFEGQNDQIPHMVNKITLFVYYVGEYHFFRTWFYENWVVCRTQFYKYQVLRGNYKELDRFYKYQVSSGIFYKYGALVL